MTLIADSRARARAAIDVIMCTREPELRDMWRSLPQISQWLISSNTFVGSSSGTGIFSITTVCSPR